MHFLTEERRYSRRKAGKLVRIRDIAPDESNPIRILGIVVDADTDTFLVQDIFDDSVDDAEKIWVMCETPLDLGKKYLLIGNIVQESLEESEGLKMNATVAYDIGSLNLSLYRSAVELESKIIESVHK
ncbi:MAG: hypothetical protein ACTSV3_00975 [Candidatus Thorarchaeota archaeon]|nr:MAG: hypothetical protein DRP09_04570 [Candidatus Thorarchaeota archaeon]